jgi:transposase
LPYLLDNPNRQGVIVTAKSQLRLQENAPLRREGRQGAQDAEYVGEMERRSRDHAQYRLTCSAESFARRVQERVPPVLVEAVTLLLETIQRLTEQIRDYDRQVGILSRDHYADSERLQQVSGVGPLTSLVYVLMLEEAQEDPSRPRCARPQPNAMEGFGDRRV